MMPLTGSSDGFKIFLTHRILHEYGLPVRKREGDPGNFQNGRSQVVEFSTHVKSSFCSLK